MPQQIGWSQEDKLLKDIARAIKKLTQVAAHLSTTSTTTTGP